MPRASDDTSVQAVKRAILTASGADTAAFFLRVIRQGIDEVIDGGRTGRWCVDQLEKTEKTYIGTKVEIIARNELDVEFGEKLDLKVAGHEVDVKMTIGSNWMIPKEAIGEICLLLIGNEERQKFAAGLLRMTADNVTRKGNRDRKVSVSANGKTNIDWLVPATTLPMNFLATLSDPDRKRIFSKRKGQARVTELLRLATGRVIPRLVIETLGQQDDPMKRIRKNGGAQDDLLAEGIVVLVGTWMSHRAVAEANGIPIPSKGEVVAFKTTIGEARRINSELTS